MGSDPYFQFLSGIPTTPSPSFAPSGALSHFMNPIPRLTPWAIVCRCSAPQRLHPLRVLCRFRTRTQPAGRYSYSNQRVPHSDPSRDPIGSSTSTSTPIRKPTARQPQPQPGRPIPAIRSILFILPILSSAHPTHPVRAPMRSRYCRKKANRSPRILSQIPSSTTSISHSDIPAFLAMGEGNGVSPIFSTFIRNPNDPVAVFRLVPGSSAFHDSHPTAHALSYLLPVLRTSAPPSAPCPLSLSDSYSARRAVLVLEPTCTALRSIP